MRCSRISSTTSMCMCSSSRICTTRSRYCATAYALLRRTPQIACLNQARKEKLVSHLAHLVRPHPHERRTINHKACARTKPGLPWTAVARAARSPCGSRRARSLAISEVSAQGRRNARFAPRRRVAGSSRVDRTVTLKSSTSEGSIKCHQVSIAVPG